MAYNYTYTPSYDYYNVGSDSVFGAQAQTQAQTPQVSNMTLNYYSMNSPASVSSSISSMSTLSTRNQYFCSKGFDFDDDMEFVPNLCESTISSGNTAVYYDSNYSSPDSSFSSSSSGGAVINTVSGAGHSFSNSSSHIKFNPYKSATFSPRTSPKRVGGSPLVSNNDVKKADGAVRV